MALVLLRLQDCAAFGYSSGTVRTTPAMEREKLRASSDYQQASFADVAQPEITAHRDASLLTQPGIFQAEVAQGTEEAERLVRIEGCQVITPPVVQRTEKKDVLGNRVRRTLWTCTFVAPPDLWTQERDEWISAATENKTAIAPWIKNVWQAGICAP